MLILLLSGWLTGCEKGGTPEDSTRPAPADKPAARSESKPQILDSFDDVAGWREVSAPGTAIEVGQGPGKEGKALRLKYDLAQTRAYLGVTKEVDLELPENFTLTFQLNRSAPENQFEFKLIDADGNTFMHKWYAFASMGRWRPKAVSRDQIAFAWGPNSGAPLKKIKKIEFIVAGTTGAGEVLIDELALISLPKGAGSPIDPASKHRARFYPRWLSDQQAYWTLVGVPKDDAEALIAEDGSLEPYKRGFSLMPFLWLDSRLFTREDAKITQSLDRGWLPIPSVRWECPELTMEVTLLAYGPVGGSVAYARYRIENSGKRPITGKLFLAIQPYQVYPPWQGGGGLSPIKSLRYAEGVVDVNDGLQIKTLSKPAAFGCQSEKGSEPEGNIVDHLGKGALPGATSVEDPDGFASGAIEFDYDLAPGKSTDYYVCFPLHERSQITSAFGAEDFEKLRAETATAWEKATGGCVIDISDQQLIDALRANIAYNLITLDGAAFQPGSRSYDKSWMRDGGSAASALLEMGLVSEPRNFVEWFSTFQQPSGEIPPIIDTKEADPLWEEKQKGLIEYDSQGEFVWTVMQCYRFTRDRDFLERMFPKVVKALRFLEQLRAQRTTKEFSEGPPEKKIFHGLLPPSTSHEGYDKKHSYWDNFWALRGWRDGLEMAEVLNHNDLMPWMEKEYTALRDAVYASMALVMKEKKVDFMPGCAELGDYDPTSSSVAVSYCAERSNLPERWLKATFDRYRDQVVAPRLKRGADYRYTPYEMRNIPALLMLGRVDEARLLLRFLMEGRRPAGWQHFAEVVHSNPRFPTYIGDMPHTWVGAEFIHAVRTLFLFESDGRLVLARGVDETWLREPGGVAVADMPSWYGKISYRMKYEGNVLSIHVSGDRAFPPPRGYAMTIPRPEEADSVLLDGKSAVLDGGEVVFDSVPAQIDVRYR